MNTRRALNLHALPTYGFGAKALTWWGTLAFIAIEGSVFAMAVGAYFYLVGARRAVATQRATRPLARLIHVGAPSHQPLAKSAH